MKRLINPNRRQKLFLAEHGLKSENWKIEKETPEYLYIVSKNGQHRSSITMLLPIAHDISSSSNNNKRSSASFFNSPNGTDSVFTP